MKQIVTISIYLCLAVLTAFSQRNSPTQDTSNKIATPTFYLYYGFAGLGSGLGSFQPSINIRGTDFLYTYEQNSYWGERSNEKDTICIKTFRQSSIDSILDIIKNLKDTTVKEYNHCIKSGGIHFLTISNSIDTTRFELMNTFDYTALKIANILNQYTPIEKKLWANEKMIKDAEECWKGLLKRWGDEDKEKKKKRKRHITLN